MVFFAASWVITAVGWVIHVFVDRHPDKRTGHRVLELFLLWMLVVTGVFAIIGGLGHISGLSQELAVQIGYAPSMFQWEVGWGDIALGVLLVMVAKPNFRDGWLTAAVVVLAVQYGGDAIGHIMQLTAHNNTAPSNVWAIPSDIAQPVIAIVVLLAYRRGQHRLAESKRGAVDSQGAQEDNPSK